MKLFPWLVCGVLAVLAFLLKFVLPGYGFSALICLILIALILFYSWMPVVGLKFPVLAKALTRICTVCLILGVLAAAVTEVFVIKASFGNPKEQVEYMVVLGAKVRESGPSLALWERIWAAADYLEENPDTIAIVSGGQGDDEPMTEAKAMYDELVALGIDPERVWMEEKATSTWENMNFTLNQIEEKTGERPAKLGIVSNEYHLFRAGLFADKCGVEAVGIPARTTRLSQKVNHFMREVAGIWHFLVLGGNYD